MDYSALKASVSAYLGMKEADAATDSLIDECIADVTEAARFRCLYRIFTEPPDFLLSGEYPKLLEATRGVVLTVSTLGAEVDRLIRYLSASDMTKSVVADAAASALLEMYADDYESGIAEGLSDRFCPGYGGTDVRDVIHILKAVGADRIGVFMLPSGLMVPQKSMAGLRVIRGGVRRTCGRCVLLERCSYRKEGVRCYDRKRK